jgi:hypothetical protein
MAAWDIENDWTDEYIQKYNETLKTRIDEYEQRGEKFTCEDLALSTLIDFAEENKLPVSFSNGKTTYDSRDDIWDSALLFKINVLTNIAADHLMNSTIGITASEANAGDIILMDDPEGKGNNNGTMNHAIMIVARSGSLFDLRQGNLPPGGGSGRYGMRGYAGLLIQKRKYNSQTDIFDRLNGSTIDRTVSNTGLIFRRWNYRRM